LYSNEERLTQLLQLVARTLDQSLNDTGQCERANKSRYA
jgi:hypothetical protein